MSRHAHFEVFQSNNDQQWYWHLLAANGEVMCQSEAYPTEQHAIRARERFPQVVAAAITAETFGTLETAE